MDWGVYSGVQPTLPPGVPFVRVVRFLSDDGPLIATGEPNAALSVGRCDRRNELFFLGEANAKESSRARKL